MSAAPRRVAVVGAGYFAPFHLDAWRQLGSPAVALCDLDGAKARTLAARFGVPRAYDKLEDMLDKERPELLDAVLPPAAQSAVVRTALARGIAVVCQKPFGADLQQATELAGLASRQGATLVVHENFRFSPWYREMRRCIDAGMLGQLHGVAFRLRPGDGQGERAYLDRQAYFQGLKRFLVRESAIHFVDVFRYLMGEVTAVTASLRRINPVIAGEDAGVIVFEFANGSMGLFDGNRLNDHPSDDPRRTMGEMWLEGSAGVMRLDGQARLWWKPHQLAEHAHDHACGPPGPFGGACVALQAHVLRHLDQGTPLENSAADYLANLKVEEAIYHSHATGRRIEMDLFNPLFPGSTTS